MNKEEYDQYWKMPSEKLYAIITEKDSSPRKHLATHILEVRRMKPLIESSKESARAAKYAAVAAIISAVVALVALVVK